MEIDDKENVNPQSLKVDVPRNDFQNQNILSTSIGDESDNKPREDLPTAQAVVVPIERTVNNIAVSSELPMKMEEKELEIRDEPTVSDQSLPTEVDNVLVNSATMRHSSTRLLNTNEDNDLESGSSSPTPVFASSANRERSPQVPKSLSNDSQTTSNQQVAITEATTTTTENTDAVYVPPPPPPGFAERTVVPNKSAAASEVNSDLTKHVERSERENSNTASTVLPLSSVQGTTTDKASSADGLLVTPTPPSKNVGKDKSSRSAKKTSSSTDDTKRKRRSVSLTADLPPLVIQPIVGVPEFVSEGPIPSTPRMATTDAPLPHAVSAVTAPFPRSSGGPQIVVEVCDASPMTPNENIVHPFVRLWLVNGNNGASLVYGSDCGIGNKPCGITSPFDIRSRRCRAPVWNQEIIFDLTHDGLNSATTNAPLLLVELLDFGDHAINGGWVSERYGGWDDLYPIAWGFYKFPTNLSLDGRRDIHIQLFPFPERLSWVERLGKAITPRFLSHAAFNATSGAQDPLDVNAAVPKVFTVYANPMNRKTEFPVGVRLRIRNIPLGHYIAKAPTMTPYELALEEYLRTSLGGAEGGQEMASLQMRKKLLSDGKPLPLKKTSKYATMDYSRRRDERSLPPNLILHDVVINGTVTAMVMCPANRLLAVATVSNFTASITVFDIHNPSFSAVAVLRGHADMIHSLSFNATSELLASGSADKTAKVWNLSNLPLFVRSTEDELIACVATYSHGFSVYGAVFVGNALVVGGYDTQLHVWRIPDEFSSLGREEGSPLLQTAQHSTAFFVFLKVTDNSKIWAIDSTHQFMLWRAEIDDGQFESLQIRRRLECPGATSADIRGNIAVVSCPTEQCILIVDTNAFLTTHRIATGKRTSYIPTSVFPDAKVVVVGTGNGRLLAWDVASGDLISSRNGYAKAQVQFSIDILICGSNQTFVAASASENEEGESKIAVLGRPRKEAEVVSFRDPRADDLIRSLFGGEVNLRRNNFQREVVRVEADKAQSVSTSPSGGPIRDRKSRMDQIMAYWQGLVQGKGTTNPSGPPTHRLTSPTDIPVSPPNAL